MKHLVLVLFLSLANLTYAQTDWSALPVNVVLDSLDTYLKHSGEYDAAARNRIFEQKKKLPSQPREHRALRYLEIGDMYSHVDIDSALRYYDLGMHVARLNDDRDEYLTLRMAQLCILPYKGMLHQAIEGIESIDPASLSRPMRSKYYYSRHLVFQNAGAPGFPDSVVTANMRLADAAMDSVMIYLDDNGRQAASAFYPYWKAIKQNRPEPPVTEVIGALRSYADTMSLTNGMLPLTASLLADAYQNEGNTEEVTRYLALSSIADIVQGKNETTSLHRLGKLMSEQEDNDRAFRYLTASLTRSVNAGARIRALEAAETLPVVIETAESRARNNRHFMIALVITLAIFAVTGTVVTLILIRSRRRRRKLEMRLARANTSKDTYIARMLEICASNIDSIENFNRIAARKIKTSQVRDLLRIVENNDVVQKQLQDFYTVFDSSFLNLHPDFVTRVNELLQPDQRLTPLADGAPLTAELRMLALMMTGIADSSRLARFLGLSLNTVYTYRTRLKGRALDRENFEKKLRKLYDISKPKLIFKSTEAITN